MKKLVAILLAFAAIGAPAHAEVDNPWTVHLDEENPFSENTLKVIAGTSWIGGMRGVMLTCTQYMEVTDFNIEASEDGTSVTAAIAVDGKVVVTMDAEVVTLTGGKLGVNAVITPEQRKVIGEALKSAKKAVHLKGAYEGGQKLIVRGSTVAGEALLTKCGD